MRDAVSQWRLHASMACWAAGYRGLYLNKAGSSREGSATFFRSARYRLHSYHTMPMSQLFREIANGGPAAERHAQLRPQLKAPGCLRNDFRRVGVSFAEPHTVFAGMPRSADWGPCACYNASNFREANNLHALERLSCTSSLSDQLLGVPA